MKFILSFAFFLLTSINTFAYEQKNLQLPSDCKLKIEQEVIRQIGKGDETFSVDEIKVVYGGVYKGISFPVVALVKTSDEVDPRDALVKTSAPENGICTVDIVELLADGSTIKF